MGILWMRISDLSTATTILTRYFSSKKLQVLSNEVLCICNSRGCKPAGGQSWRSENMSLLVLVSPDILSKKEFNSVRARFFATSKFDLLQFCSLLNLMDVHYFIWKCLQFYFNIWRDSFHLVTCTFKSTVIVSSKQSCSPSPIIWLMDYNSLVL